MTGKIKKVVRRKKSVTAPASAAPFERYGTMQLLKMTGRLARETVRSFWNRHKIVSRITAISLLLLILFSIFSEVYNPKKNIDAYDLTGYASQFLSEPVPLYGEKLKYDQTQDAIIFNEGYTPGGGVIGDSASPKVTAKFGGAPENSVTVSDPVNSVSVTLKPKFRLREPQKEDDKVVYPILGKPAIKVYSVKGSGVKEDIIFSKAPSTDTVEFVYDLILSDGLEARLEVDGSIGVYGASSVLLGDVAASTEADAELLKKARDNADKTRFIFGIPAPYVVEKDATSMSETVKAKFELNGNELKLKVENMKAGVYPLSVDPTIYVESAAKLMRGNNETNTDFDTTNELIQKSQTTGARIDAWQGNLDMSQATWDHSTTAAGGYIYRTGGRTGPSLPVIAGQQQTLDGSNGTSFVMNMPATRPAGDLYVALMCHDGSNGSNMSQTGGGWTEVTGSDVQGFVAYYKVGTDQGGGNEAASYTFTGPSEEYAGVILRITGADTSSPISASGVGSNAGAVTPVFPTVTPAHDATLVIRAVGFDQDDPPATSWVPTGHTKIDSSSSSGGGNGSCGFAAASLDTSPLSGVATGTTTLAGGGISDDYGGASIAIRPASTTTATQSTVDWAKFNSSTLAIESPNPGTGVCSGWCNDSDYNLPSARRGHSMVAYNGYLYVMGGLNSAGTRQSTVYIAKLGANGEPQLWHPTDTDKDNWVYWFSDTGLNGGTAKSYLSAYAYNNTMYVVGGQTNASAGGVTTVESAIIRPNGQLGTWTTTGMQALPAGAGTHMNTVHIYNDVMYTLGGFEGVVTSSANLRSAVYYSKLASDGTMSPWTSTTGFSTARATFGGSFSTVWGAYIYLTGGCTAVNGSGYCSTIASDTQIASINADGTISEWGGISSLLNQRQGYSLTGWQGGLYRIGGCTRINTSTGECASTVSDVDYGVINPAGEVSTVDITVGNGTAPCSGGSPTSCSLPGDDADTDCDPDSCPGDDAGEVGHMLNMSTIINGFLYVIGGCTEYTCNTGTNSPTADDISSNTAYVAIAADGSMVSPPSCGGTTYGAWCVDSTNTINGADGVAAAGITVFNNRIYVVGGLDSTANETGELYYNTVNPTTGALTGAWTTQTLASVGIGENIFYNYIYARANPSQAGTYDGNLYVFGGCGDGGSGAGCANNDYETEVYKCWIEDTGEIENTAGNAAFDCTTTGQLQIDSTPGTGGTDGLGIHSGTVYANYIYLIGGISQAETDKDDVLYAKFDDNNNVVAVSGGTWIESANKLSVGRRRGWAFGYNGHIYAVGGFDADVGSALPFIEWSKINVSDGSIGGFVTSSVQINQRWGLNVAVSNSYAYVIGGCDEGISPGGCTSFEPAVQTFQLYNNDSGGANNYTAQSDDTFTAAEDRWGASAVVHNGYLYVAGGCISATDCTDATNSTQYAPITAADGTIGTWLAGGNLPQDRAWGGLEVIGGTLYYVGGQNDGGTAQTSIYYTSGIVSGNPTWATATATLPEARTKFGYATWNNRFYVVGGLNATPAVTNTVLYSAPQPSGGNMAGSSWTTSSTSFDVARRGHAVTSYGNNLYLFGGFDGTNYLSDVQFASLGYKTGTIGQSGTTVTGSGTTFTSAMVGSVLQYPDGSTATISTFTSATSITVSASKTVTAGTLYTVLDGSVGDWTFTTSLPTALSDSRAVSANGYIYLIGGRSATSTCTPKTLITPISANTTNATGNNPTGVGEWYETNVRYATDRYGAAVAYDKGKIYTMGGGCTAPIDCSTGSVCNYYSTVRSQPQVAIYSRMIDTDTNVFPNSWLMNGLDNSVGARWQGQYRSSADSSNVVFHESFDDGTNGSNILGLNQGGTNSDYNFCYSNNGTGTASRSFSNAWSITPGLSSLYATTGGDGNAVCDFTINDTSTSTTRYDRFYINVTALPTTNTAIYTVEDNNSGDTVAQLRILSAANGGTLQLRDQFTAEDEVALGVGVHRIEVGIVNDFMTVRVYSGANLHTETISDSDIISLGLGPNTYDEINFGIAQASANWSFAMDEHKSSVSNWLGSAYPNWGQNSTSSDVIMGDVATYVPRNIAGTDTEFARWYYFKVSIDASKTFGYPEDVNRGPTISDLSLFFTADPNKRLRHGKTFTGGEQQPLDTPCRQSVDAQCPLP